jgi:hypothetical protein
MKTASTGMLLRYASVAGLALWSPPFSSSAAEDAATVIARARAYLGTDAALDAVKSLHFLGTVTADDGTTHKIEIIMRRPMHELMIETSDKKRVVTALDDYTVWRREEPLDRPGMGRVQLMNAHGVRHTRANVAQTLFYYRDLESVGGTVAVEAEEDIEGVTCVRTVFTHPGNIRYIRYFEKTTGRLVVTRSDGGSETREVGEMTVAGIRFPKELTTVVDGKTNRVTFDEIRVNEEFDLAIFQVPRPTFDFDRPPGQAGAPATPASDAPAAESPPAATPPPPAESTTPPAATSP